VENKKRQYACFFGHGNTAFWLQLLILFLPAPVPAVISAVSLPIQHDTACCQPTRGKRIVLRFYSSPDTAIFTRI